MYWDARAIAHRLRCPTPFGGAGRIGTGYADCAFHVLMDHGDACTLSVKWGMMRGVG